jgi:hypothetical protein
MMALVGITVANQRFSEEYLEVLVRGPFPAQIDPWAEDPRYFHQIHGSMIEAIVGQTRDILLMRGIHFNRLESLQMVTSFPLDALHIKQNGELVTVIELISPDTKSDSLIMADYLMHRDHTYINRGVNLIEIDLTRSENRLLHLPLTNNYPYHIAIYLPGDSPRLITMELYEPLKRFALPLRNEVIPVELQQAYAHGYELYSIAAQIRHKKHYTEDCLPFPTMMTESQRREALETVQRWQDELKRLEAS